MTMRVFRGQLNSTWYSTGKLFAKLLGTTLRVPIVGKHNEIDSHWIDCVFRVHTFNGNSYSSLS